MSFLRLRSFPFFCQSAGSSSFLPITNANKTNPTKQHGIPRQYNQSTNTSLSKYPYTIETMSTSSSSSSNNGVPTSVKWGKQKIELTLRPENGVKGLKAELEEQTGVPIERMKIMPKSKGKRHTRLLPPL